jgi:hypothetical protein|tara:strand:+ start:4759 stop:4920 length:162 start_codon:yes stop_codon:yes gene_type:complete
MYHKDNPDFDLFEEEDWDGNYPGEDKDEYEEEAWSDFCEWCDQVEKDNEEMPF